MGLLKTGFESFNGVYENSWREYIYCESLPPEILVSKGMKRTSKNNNNKGSNNIISNGSIIAINEGQCMMIVEQGKVVEFSAEPGEYLYDTSTEPTILYTDDLASSIKETFMQIGKRFTFSGEAPKDQRVYYFNIKEIIGNKYGTPTPIPFRVVDRNIGLDMDISIRCHGEFSYKIVNPLLFYSNVSGNVEKQYSRTQIESQLKAELITALQPALAQISANGVRYSEVPAHTTQLAKALNNVLSDKWLTTRGIAIVSFGINALKASAEDEAMMKQLQRSAVMRTPGMAAAHLTGAQADAMIGAANNEAGAITGFIGLNHATQYSAFPADASSPIADQSSNAATINWTCNCGTSNTKNFCPVCGAPKPKAEKWTCSCSTLNNGIYCTECGKKKPDNLLVSTCVNCGWRPINQMSTPNFCPKCGNQFAKNDTK